MAARKIRTPEKEAEFLDTLVETGGNISRAAQMCGLGLRTVYDWREDEDFRARLEDALQKGLQVMEDEVHRRAFHGTDRPVFHQGEQCGVVREYSDTLAIFILKARCPEKYRERSQVEHSGAIDLRKAPREELERELAQLLGSAKGDPDPESDSVAGRKRRL